MNRTQLENIINSSIATAIAEFATLPICTIKTNYQNTHALSSMAVTKQLYKQQGLLIFYRASPVSIVSQIFSTSSKYVIYRYLEDQNYKYSNKVLNGITSGVITSFFTHPLDVIKIHHQMNTPFVPEFFNHGPKIMYRGYSKTFGKILITSALFLPLYEYSNEIIDNPFVSSLITATIATTIVHPIDYLKTRQMYGLCHVNKTITASSENFLKYYKGLSINLLRVVPHFIIVMTTIEYLKSKNTYFN